MRSLTIRQIEAFRTLVETGTVTRAAQQLNVSQPSVSRVLAHLEAESGLVLFDRRPGRLELTAAGYRLYEEIERLFGRLETLDQAIATIRREQSGDLSIGVTPALAQVLLPQVSTALLASQPGLFLSIDSVRSAEVVERLQSRRIDIGLVFQGPRLDSPSLCAESIARAPLVCILPKGHELAKKARLEPADLDGVPFVSSSPRGRIRQNVDRAFAEAGAALNIVVETMMVTNVAEFVAAGVGVSLVHPLFSAPTRGEVHVRRFEPAMDAEFLMLYTRQPRDARLIERFRQELQGAVAAFTDRAHPSGNRGYRGKSPAPAGTGRTRSPVTMAAGNG